MSRIMIALVAIGMLLAVACAPITPVAPATAPTSAPISAPTSAPAATTAPTTAATQVATTVATTAAATTAPSSSAEIEKITFALPGNPGSMFVPKSWLVSTGAAMSLVQEGLLGFNQDLGLQPAVADKWEAKDPTTYVYHIRPGVKFSDGTPLTAEDVVFSMKYTGDAKTGSQIADFYVSVDSITATAPDEITVKLKKPDATFQYTPAHMAGFIMSKAQFEAHPEDIGTPAVLPLGTGPYKLTKFVPGQEIDLAVNEYYWGPKPAVKNIVLKLISDSQTALIAMRNGEIDGAFEIQASELDQWKQIPGVQILSKPSLLIDLLTLNANVPPLNDIHVRRAIWYAVNRQGIVSAVLNNLGQAANNINPPEMWATVMSQKDVQDFYATLMPIEFNLDKAKAELAQSSSPNGFTLDLEIPNHLPYQAQVAQVLEQDFQKIGIKLNVSVVDKSVFYGDYGNHKFPLFLRSYAPDYADPSNYPFLFLSKGASLNGSAYDNPEFDTALTNSLASPDPATRATELKKALAIVDKDVPIVPIFWGVGLAAIGKNIEWTGFTAFYFNQPWALMGLTPKQ